MAGPILLILASYQYSGAKTTLVNKSTTPGSKPVTLRVAFHPTRGVFYLALPGQNQVAVYSINPTTGAVTFFKEVANQGMAPCWLAVNSAG
ncbi:MAG TPA: hypothetical protein VKE24_12200, partial [Candidatus Acidoferrales bacterium]|nr:hypothetical protein [Candidatus Acidoferrales bacterium]